MIKVFMAVTGVMAYVITIPQAFSEWNIKDNIGLETCMKLRATSIYEVIPNQDYQHNKMGTLPVDGKFYMGAYEGSFDGIDDDDGDGKPDYLGVPEWISYEIKAKETIPIGALPPSHWYEHIALRFLVVQPGVSIKRLEDSYINYKSEYAPGQLIRKETADRIDWQSGCNTYFFMNAIPMSEQLRDGAWAALQTLAEAYANTYGQVWVTAGPVFNGDYSQKIGELLEAPIFKPFGVFMVISRYEGDRVTSLAFILPQDAKVNKSIFGRQPCKSFGIKELSQYAVSIDKVETETRLSFLTNINPDSRDDKSIAAKELWAVKDNGAHFECGAF